MEYNNWKNQFYDPLMNSYANKSGLFWGNGFADYLYNTKGYQDFIPLSDIQLNEVFENEYKPNNPRPDRWNASKSQLSQQFGV